jgi:hypothetical protein
MSALDIHHPRAREVASRYTGTANGLEELGWGVGGAVFLSPSGNAVKIHRQRENFSREIAAYSRLLLFRVDSVQGFSIPRLVKIDLNLQVIEMSFVTRPWLLDFGNSRIDRPPDFSADVLTEWWAELEHRFGDRFAVVQSVYYEMVNRFGIYCLDLKPGNIEFAQAV